MMRPFILNVMMVAEVVIALVIILLVLMQRSKAGGGLSAVSGGAAEEVFGAKTGNILTRATVIFAIIFLVNTLGITALQKGRAGSDIKSVTELMSTATQETPSDVETPALPDRDDTIEVPLPAPSTLAAPVEMPAQDPQEKPEE